MSIQTIFVNLDGTARRLRVDAHWQDARCHKSVVRNKLSGQIAFKCLSRMNVEVEQITAGIFVGDIGTDAMYVLMCPYICTGCVMYACERLANISRFSLPLVLYLFAWTAVYGTIAGTWERMMWQKSQISNWDILLNNLFGPTKKTFIQKRFHF